MVLYFDNRYEVDHRHICTMFHAPIESEPEYHKEVDVCTRG